MLVLQLFGSSIPCRCLLSSCRKYSSFQHGCQFFRQSSPLDLLSYLSKQILSDLLYQLVFSSQLVAVYPSLGPLLLFSLFLFFCRQVLISLVAGIFMGCLFCKYSYTTCTVLLCASVDYHQRMVVEMYVFAHSQVYVCGVARVGPL